MCTLALAGPGVEERWCTALLVTPPPPFLKGQVTESALFLSIGGEAASFKFGIKNFHVLCEERQGRRRPRFVLLQSSLDACFGRGVLFIAEELRFFSVNRRLRGDPPPSRPRVSLMPQPWARPSSASRTSLPRRTRSSWSTSRRWTSTGRNSRWYVVFHC